MKAKVHVTLKPGVLDPQGQTIARALAGLGFSGVGGVRQGKYFELDLADQLLAHIEAADEMRRHADVAEQREHMLGNPVVQHAFAVDRPALLRVERGGIILEILDQGARFGTLIENLRFAFVDLAATGHGRKLSVGTK